MADGTEVIVPTYTFAASAETVLYCRARPVLVDVDEGSLNITPAAAAAALTARTSSVEVVHVGGLPADLTAIDAAIEAAAGRLGRSKPPLVEDAAHAFPVRIASLGGRYAGTIGRAGAFSFYATKTMTTGEGGMLVTDDDALADRARSMRLHGISRDAWKRYAAGGSWYYEIEAAGFKDNLTDVAAALGIVQLDRAEGLKAARMAIAGRYAEALGDLAQAGRIRLPEPGVAGEHAWHLFVIRLSDDAPGEVDMALPGVAGLPPALRRLGVTTGVDPRRPRLGRRRDQRPFHPPPPASALSVDGLRARRLSRGGARLRRRRQPADLAGHVRDAGRPRRDGSPRRHLTTHSGDPPRYVHVPATYGAAGVTTG